MSGSVNKERGEVALTLGGRELVLCATMKNLGHFNEVIGERSIQDAMQLLGPKDPDLTGEILGALTVRGDAAKAWEKAAGIMAMTDAVKAIQGALFPSDEDEEGNAEAGQGSQ